LHVGPLLDECTSFILARLPAVISVRIREIGVRPQINESLPFISYLGGAWIIAGGPT